MSIMPIMSGGFAPDGLAELDEYADRVTCGVLIHKPFSSSELCFNRMPSACYCKPVRCSRG